MKKITVKAPISLKALFKEECTFLPPYMLNKLCEKKEIKINGAPAKPADFLAAGDVVTVFYSEEKYPHYAPVYEDENLLIANKKRGVSYENLLAYLTEKHAEIRPVHRLDTNTAGLIAFAKTAEAERELLAAIKERRVEKKYLCRVYGTPSPSHATLKHYLLKNAQTGLVKILSTPQKNALSVITEYELLEDLGDGTSVLSVTLHTGRTHQIRAHLAYIGHFIVGDGKYGNGTVNKHYGREKQELSACSLTFIFAKESPLFYLSGREFSCEERFFPKD